MLLGKDHAGAGGLLLLQHDDFRTKKMLFLHRTDPRMSVHNKNRSKVYVFARPPDTTHYSTQKKSHVEIDPKFYVFFFVGCPLVLSLNRIS